MQNNAVAYVLFQSTLPRGERPSIAHLLCSAKQISIHAPARGATTSTMSTHHITFLFQSTLPRGERLRYRMIDVLLYVFQSTLPRGERLVQLVVGLCIKTISIHAPARGATVKLLFFHHAHRISIHAPARGATLKNLVDLVDLVISIDRKSVV